MDKIKNSVTGFFNSLKLNKTTDNRNHIPINCFREDDDKSVGSYHSFEIVDTTTTTEAIKKEAQAKKQEKKDNDLLAKTYHDLTQQESIKAISEDKTQGVELTDLSSKK